MKTFLKRKVTNFNFFFSFLANTVYLKRGYTWGVVSLSSLVFIGTVKYESGKTWVFKFFSKAEEFWSFFWKIISFNRINSVGFFAELELIGLGFRIKKITRSIYRFFWGHSNYVYLFVPATVLVEYSPEERMIFFFSTVSSKVNGLSSYLMLLKKLSSYRVTGFIKPGKIIRLNSGKQR